MTWHTIRFILPRKCDLCRRIMFGKRWNRGAEWQCPECREAACAAWYNADCPAS